MESPLQMRFMCRGAWRCAEVFEGVHGGTQRCVPVSDDQSNSNSVYLPELLALNLTAFN